MSDARPPKPPRTPSARPLPRALAVAAFVATLLAAAPAAAYIDPGTGSVVVQAIVAGVMGAGLVVKTYWRRIRALFGGAAAEDAPGPRDDASAPPGPRESKDA